MRTSLRFLLLLVASVAGAQPGRMYFLFPIAVAMRAFVVIFLLLPSTLLAQWTGFVDPFIGTGGTGHTFPGATAPFGMVQLSPDTRVDGSWEGCAGYYYDDDAIYGFSHTHLSGTGISDYGDVMFMPYYGEVTFEREEYRSAFRHNTEEASPGYYAVTLDDDGIRVRLTATTRVGLQEYTFPREGIVNVILDLTHRDRLVEGRIETIGGAAIRGMRHSTGWADNQRVFFHTEFSKPWTQIIEHEGPMGHLHAVFRFRMEAGEKLLVKTGLSSADEAGAGRNVEAEMPGWDFEAVRRAAEKAWNHELGRIEVEGGTEDGLTNFYTALYHTMIAPNTWSDVDGRYRGHDGDIHQADHDVYTVFSLWDTFRTLHPLLTLIDPDRTRDFVRTMLLIYEQGGRLPVWELAGNETETMIGFHSVPVIADAYVKGIRGFDEDLALEAMIAAAEHDAFGQPAFREKGFLEIEDESESVSKTLEYAYDHWVVAQMARWLGHADEAEKHERLSLGYRNVLDPEGFMRPRRNGGWLTPFDPFEVNNNYTEANSWHYSFFVPHDIGGWTELLGGEKALENRLDALFSASSDITGRQQADITGLIGQYVQGNEPSHHFAYLYNYAGVPEKTQRLIRRILTTLYRPTPNGLPGNEDCGQMSAWFVMSAMGLYPVTPGESSYAVTSPLFPTVHLHLENGRTFTIHAEGGGPYIAGLALNGADHELLTIDHGDVIEGGELAFSLSTAPAEWGRMNAVPRVEDDGFVPVPVIEGERSFRGEQTIRLAAPDSGAQILYTNAADPDARPKPYAGPFVIGETTEIWAVVVNARGDTSARVHAEFFRQPNNWTVTIDSEPNPQYAASGPDALIDGIRGDEDWRKGDWMGFQGQDVVATIDFGEVRSISAVYGSFLQDTGPWIVFPREVVFEVATEPAPTEAGGERFREILRVGSERATEASGPETAELGGAVSAEARYLRVRAVSSGPLPDWHLSAGNPSWVFVDEVWVE